MAILSTATNAQLKDTFEKATLIKEDGSTIKGYLKSDPLSRLSQGFCFKENLDQENCTQYSVNSGIKSLTTTSGKNFKLLKDVKINNNTSLITVFGDLILKSEKGLSLLKTYDNNKDPFYIIFNQKGEKFALQKDKLENGELQLTKFQFKGILNLALNGALRNETEIINFN